PPLRRTCWLAPLGFPILRGLAALALRSLPERCSREGSGSTCAEDVALDRHVICQRRTLIFQGAGADAGGGLRQRRCVAHVCTAHHGGASGGTLPGIALRRGGIDRRCGAGSCASS